MPQMTPRDTARQEEYEMKRWLYTTGVLTTLLAATQVLAAPIKW